MLIHEFIPTIETERLHLRPIASKDIDAVFRLYSNDEVTRFFDVETFTHRNEAKAMVEQFITRNESGESLRWAITCKESDNLIGTCGFKNLHQRNRYGLIGFDLMPEYWNQGIMLECLKAVLDYGFHDLELNRVEAMVMVGNAPSVRVLNKLGFQMEGLLRQRGCWKGAFHDLKIFSLLQKDYQA